MDRLGRTQPQLCKDETQRKVTALLLRNYPSRSLYSEEEAAILIIKVLPKS